jgi:mycofactocin system glycosyltransferase
VPARTPPTAGPALPAAPDAPLPDGFAVRLDARTRRREEGGVLLGGSPLRLIRLSPRAHEMLPGERLVVRDPLSAALAGRLLDAGVAHPDPGDAGPPEPPDLTVVVPVRDRPVELARLLAAVRADAATRAAPVLVVDDGSADPERTARIARAHRAGVVRHEAARGPAAARNAGLRAARTALVAFLDSDCVPRPGWLAPLLPHLADPRLAVVAPRIGGLAGGPTGPMSAYDEVAGALDMGAHAAPVRPGTAVSYVPSAALLARRAALGEGFDESMPVAEDVDLGWRLDAAGWRVRYEPRAMVEHEHPVGLAPWLRRRAFYGTGAALLAARHGAAVAPLVLAPSSAVVCVLLVAGGRSGRVVAAAVLGLDTVRLARRLAAGGRRPELRLAAGLVLRGTASAGRALARSTTRHHWPLAVLATADRRARRLLPAVALADALLAWWPHRGRIGPVRFAVARRVDDLAYGAGLWWGAVRARSPAALLPARPPPVAPRPGVGRRERWWKRRAAVTMGAT